MLYFCFCFLCIICVKIIINLSQYYTANRVSWISRLTLLDLRTNWTQWMHSQKGVCSYVGDLPYRWCWGLVSCSNNKASNCKDQSGKGRWMLAFKLVAKSWTWPSDFISLHSVHRGFPGGAGGKDSTCNAGAARDTGSVPGSGRSSGGGHGTPIQYSCLENPRDTEALWVAKGLTEMKEFSTYACTQCL